MSNWSGKTLGKVQIGEMLARGGMAEVYIGEHTTLNRKVAVKIMRDHVEADPDNRVRFEREARVVASLRHPNIIQVFDYELVDGQPCLVMELVTGASLGEYLKALHKRGEKLPLETIAHILTALGSAIDYAHQQNIIHRDVKPANVLLRSATGPIDPNRPLPADSEPILTDFGLVRLLDSSIQTSTGTVSGTPIYMSPEQARGDKVGAKTDVYSLGVILYEMLAGNVPFEAESTFGILMKHLNEPPPPIAGISPNLQAIINRALAKDINLRYPSARELADEFTAVLNGRSLSAETVRLAKIPQMPASKPRQAAPSRLRIGIGSAFLVVIAILAFVFWPSRMADKNQPVGRISYLDQNSFMDKSTILITKLPAPKTGMHYEAWYLAQGGEIRRKVGSIPVDRNSQGQLIFTIPEQENILGLYDQLEITVEPDNDPNPNEPSGEVAASSVFPPLALIHVRHVLVSFTDAPESTSLILGLWNSTDTLYDSVTEMQTALESGDEKLFRQKNEEIINLLVGNQNKDQYQDWDKNNSLADPSDGFGLLRNGEPGYTEQGYLFQTISHARFAAEAADSTDSIKTRSAETIICLENMTGWSEQLLALALQLQDMPFGSEMTPIATEMSLLADHIIAGIDSNNNGLIEPIVGEGGATTAYEYAYYMAEMPLLTGAHRIPPPASKNK